MTFLNLGPPFYFILALSLLSAAVVGQAQENSSPYLPTRSELGATDPVPVPDESGPSIPGMPEDSPVWTWQRTTGNPPGTVRNTHQGMVSEDGSQQLRQHVVENPRGEMVQSWERSQTEDGYLYRRAQTFTAPDGTLLRQHEQSLSGTDPYNYTRQHEMTLRDGRTILHSQTRSWDGTTGTMERTFSGPNGQPPEKKRWGWVGKLNPFREGGFFRPNKTSSSASSTPPGQSGFTLGSGGRSRMGHVPPGLSRQQPGQPSSRSSRPPWAGPSASASPPHRTGMAFPPKLGLGRKR